MAVINGSGDEIRVMGVTGEGARRAASAGDGFLYHDIAWSPDGRFLATLKGWGSNLRTSVVEIHDLGGGPPVAVVSSPGVSTFTWASDGRLIYAQGEPPPKQESYGLWELPLDPRTARPMGKPRQLASWLSQSVLSISASRDGRRVMVTKGRTRGNVFVGQLDSIAGLTNVRQLTRDDRVNWPSGWMPDSRTVLFNSDRNGNFQLFKQGTAEREASLQLPGPGEARAARVTPDGRWILYLARSDGAAGPESARVRLMRMPVGGGPAETVLETVGNWGRGEGLIFADGDYTWSCPQFRCPSRASTPCIIGEAGPHHQTVFTAFDPMSGRKGEVARVDGVAEMLAWDLSPDGSRVAFASPGYFGVEGQAVNVLTLSDKTVRRIPLPGAMNPSAVAWAPSGGDLFVANYVVRGGALLTVDMTGRMRVLLNMVGKGVYLASPSPSPDGRLLAFAQATAGANAWLLELQQR